MLFLIAAHGDALLGRGCTAAHMTASSMIVNKARTKVLMAYHKIYRSWSWTGGHNDGETDFLAVAMREAREETGIKTLRMLGKGPASVEILPVWAHVKREKWVGSHLHLNVSYLFEADESEALRIAEEENSAVGWLEIASLEDAVSESYMLPIYRRLIGRAK
ncbi:MAG: NUDIX hydrolase [Clostridia bacterium]|nr:NUDIX hydrolase [Clostridia bacterium]